MLQYRTNGIYLHYIFQHAIQQERTFFLQSEKFFTIGGIYGKNTGNLRDGSHIKDDWR